MTNTSPDERNQKSAGSVNILLCKLARSRVNVEAWRKRKSSYSSFRQSV